MNGKVKQIGLPASCVKLAARQDRKLLHRKGMGSAVVYGESFAKKFKLENQLQLNCCKKLCLRAKIERK